MSAPAPVPTEPASETGGRASLGTLQKVNVKPVPEPIPFPTPEDARLSLTDHVLAKGAEAFARYGPRIGWQELQRILADRDFVRYPCELVFDSGPLQAGEIAYPMPKEGKPEDGYLLCVHPLFALDPARVPIVALYQLVVINYGSFAGPEDAEAFASAALGMSCEDYYTALCAMADEIGMSVEGSIAVPDDSEESFGVPSKDASPFACSCGGSAGPSG